MGAGDDDTAEQSWQRAGRLDADTRPQPGLVKVFSRNAACFDPRPLGAGLVIGRGAECDVVLDEARSSRRHAEVMFVGGEWRVRDLGSRNGTFLDGSATRQTCTRRGLLGVGDTLFLLCEDVAPLLGLGVEVRDDIVIGPRLQRLWRELEGAARASAILHVSGETGTGKELAARAFHQAGPRAKGPFVAVNCAAIPPLIAERLLFGARRGAYSGATTDADGYLGAADGGTIFLDEIAELPAEVQAKLLRVVETGELLSLGAARPRKIDVAICSATHGDLRARVTAGKFREDLYFRLGRPQLTLPPLGDRLEDVPWIVERVLQRTSPPRRAHVSFMEAVLLRAWPGNVRELIQETAEAARRADGDGRVLGEHLRPDAGQKLDATEIANGEEAQAARIREVLRRENGNVSRTARELGMHRTQLRRWLARHGEKPASDDSE